MTGTLRILFKKKYNLPVTDPRYKDATDEDIALDYLLTLAGNDFSEIPDDLEDDELDLLAQVEAGEISMDDFFEYETEKYLTPNVLKALED